MRGERSCREMWPFLRSCEWNQKRKGIDMKRIVDLEKIIAVLLPDGKWHDVHKGSFKVDGYINAEDGVRYE